MAIAKITTDGDTQIVRLPIGFHFDCDEVEVEKIGSVIRLVPQKSSSTELLEALTGFSDDFADIVDEAHNSFAPSKREEL